jgi:glycosyltransferase involved in cell wall biosynthesis
MTINCGEEPLVSIVIPSFNQGNFLEQTLVSILGQNYQNKEIIVIDGGSNDQTLEILEKYSSVIDYYVSEPDNGQADAINKGFRLAKGDILAWLNSDDMYLPCTLSKIASILGISKEPKLIYGGCLLFSEGGTYTEGRLPPQFDADKLTYYDYIEQSSTFWTRSLWEAVGELNESYKYTLDWDWFIRASKVSQFTPIRDYFSLYRFHENHKTSTGGTERKEEIVKIVEAYASEQWSEVYRDLYRRTTNLRVGFKRLMKLRLYRFRQLFYPKLYLKHSKHSIEDIVMRMI